MTALPVRPVSPAELAVRAELAPQAGQILRSAEVRPVPALQGTVAGQITLRTPTTPHTGATDNPAQEIPAEGRRSAAGGAATRQSALGPLLADLLEALRTPGLGQQVKAAAVRVLALQPTLPPDATGFELKRALSRSGLFLEARLAAGLARPGDARDAARQVLSTDAKAAMLVLREALRTWLATQPKAPAPPSSRLPPPPPPYAGGPTGGQPPTGAKFSEGASAPSVGHQLLQDAEGALARQELLQFASLPEGSRRGDLERTWMFELPVATPRGAAIAQFEISREGQRGHAGAGTQPIWRARFSIDTEALGPVHAHVTLRSGSTKVSLWAERNETADLLHEQGGHLASLLRRSGSRSAEVLVHQGAPKARDAAPGQFVDEAS